MAVWEEETEALERSRGKKVSDNILKSTIIQRSRDAVKTHLTLNVTNMTMDSDVKYSMRYFVLANIVWEPKLEGRGATEIDMIYKGKSQGKGTIKDKC